MVVIDTIEETESCAVKRNAIDVDKKHLNTLAEGAINISLLRKTLHYLTCWQK